MGRAKGSCVAVPFLGQSAKRGVPTGWLWPCGSDVYFQTEEICFPLAWRWYTEESSGAKQIKGQWSVSGNVLWRGMWLDPWKDPELKDKMLRVQ